MTEAEIEKNAINFIQNQDEEGFHRFMATLTNEEIAKFNEKMDNYKKIIEKAKQW